MSTRRPSARVDKKKLYALYKGRGVWAALYTRVKFKLCPLPPVEPLLPEKGRVLDLGRGNGRFAAILKLGSEARAVSGFDLDEGPRRMTPGSRLRRRPSREGA